MKGAITCMSFLDFRGGLIPASTEQWKEGLKDNKDMTERQQARMKERKYNSIINLNFKQTLL